MKITARNYASQAEIGLRHWAECVKGEPRMAADSVMVGMLADIVKNAVHFALPDNGALFDDNLRGMRGQEFRLPFPSITAEYFVDDSKHDQNQTNAMTEAPKRLAIASEISVDLLRKIMPGISPRYFDGKGDVAILIQAACEVKGAWVPVISGWLTPCDWDNTEGSTPIAPLIAPKKGSPAISGFPLPTCPGFQQMMIEKIGPEDAFKNMNHDIAGEVAAILELCEALSCTNVVTENLFSVDKVKNARRMRDGKAPMYETKILKIDMPNAKTSSGCEAGGERGSPRHHLRRGHIRIIQDQRRIWVNSCAVGNREIGIIDKSYHVTARHVQGKGESRA